MDMTWELPLRLSGTRGSSSAASSRAVDFLELHMKAILAAALVFGLCGLAPGLARAGDEKADPVGTWKCEYGIEGQKRTSTLIITQDGDKLAGTMSWPDQKDEPLKDVKLKDGTLTFSAKRLL